jgi:hypothetical protein
LVAFKTSLPWRSPACWRLSDRPASSAAASNRAHRAHLPGRRISRRSEMRRRRWHLWGRRDVRSTAGGFAHSDGLPR